MKNIAILGALCWFITIQAAIIPPMPPSGLSVAPLSAPVAVSPMPKLVSGVRVLLGWGASNTNAIGYYVYAGASTNFFAAQKIGFTTNLSLEAMVPNGSTNYFWVTGYALSGEEDSLPLNSLRFVAPKKTPTQLLTPSGWAYSTDGFTGMTNVIQSEKSLNGTNWTTRLTFVGRSGVFTNVLSTNSAGEFFRLIAK